jgi:hypothetical protein
MRNLTSLVDRWRRQGIELLPPPTLAEIEATFSSVGAIATPDVVALYTAVGGIPGTDESFWSLWSMEEIRKENTVPSPFGVLFSDYMISCWCYRVRANQDATSSVLVDYFDGNEPSVVAESVEEFVDMYLRDPDHFLQMRSLQRVRTLS